MGSRSASGAIPDSNPKLKFSLASACEAGMLRRMLKLLTFFVVSLIVGSVSAQSQVLIVADEFPAMRVIANKVKSEAEIESRLVAQTNLPRKLDAFDTVIVYIHGDISEQAESTLINYTEAGGKLLVLHHSISSAKRKNAHWFDFLGVNLPEGDVTNGGYKWIEGVTWQLVNVNPDHFIVTNRVNYPDRIAYTETNSPEGKRMLPGFTLEDSEVYLNHVWTAPHTPLMGLKYTDAVSGKTYMQSTAGWIKPAAKAGSFT